MKTSHTLIIAAAIVIAGVLGGRAQSFGSITIGPIAPTSAGCPLSAANSATLCPVGTAAPYAMFVSYNGATAQPLTSITSFNKRTGDITLTSADVVNSGVKIASSIQ